MQTQARDEAEPRVEGYLFDRFRRRQLLDDLSFGAGKEPGWPMPDFDLPTLSAGRIRKSDFMGRRPVLFTFASVTDPISASAAPVLKELHRELGEAVAFVTVYVREAHPGERIPQPRTMAWKVRHARMLKARDGLPWTVAIDDVEGSFHRALGANSNSAYLMDPGGNVAFRALWSNDRCLLRQGLRAMAAGATARPVARERRLVSLPRALTRADEVLRLAGAQALEDLRREAPLVFAAAEVAWVWRALTPTGRLALVALAASGVAALYGGTRLLAGRRR